MIGLTPGFENVDASLLRDLLVILVACVGLALGVKKLFFDKTPAGFSQPFMVALEKEFVARPEYERRHADMESQLKEVRVYAHTEVHGLAEVVHAVSLDARNRNERLAALEADSKTHTRQLDNLGLKVDKIVDRVGDKVEILLRNERGQK